jgi:hypothetical protein
MITSIPAAVRGEPGPVAERDASVSELGARALGLPQFLLLCAAGSAGVLGWAMAGLTVDALDRGPTALLTAGVTAVVCLGLLVVAGVLVGAWTRRGQDVRDELDLWAGLGVDEDVPVAAPDCARRLEAAPRCALWLAAAGVLCPTGLVLLDRAVPGTAAASLGATVYALGEGASVLLTGILAAARPLGHQIWSAPLLRKVPARRGGGAHR